MAKSFEEEQGYRIYDYQFFRSLTARILRRSGLGAHLQEFAPDIHTTCTQFGLWDAMREMVDWLSHRGCASFTRASLYHDRAQALTPEQVETDLVEVAVLYVRKSVPELRAGAPFPQSEYEECVLLALFYALINYAVKGDEFGPCFELNLPSGGNMAQIHQALYGHSAQERWEGYMPLRQWISVLALERLEDFMVSLSVDERAAFKRFVDGWVERWKIDYLNLAPLMRIIAMYCALRQGYGRDVLLFVGYPPLLKIVPQNWAKLRREHDSHLLPIA